MRWRQLFPVLLSVTACNGARDRDGAACGLAALAGPAALLTQFSVPQQTLAAPPRRLPEQLVTRVVAGPALRSIVGRTDAGLVIGVEGSIPEAIQPGYGVLVVDQEEHPRGVMLYQGLSVEGAPTIGALTIGAETVPLLGIQLDPAKFENPDCPFFPDSVLQ